MPKSVLLNEALGRSYERLLRCPICHKSMQLINMKSLVCEDRHCFDLAKQGYVNLLSHGIKTKYNKELFEARKALAQSGFFEPLNEKLSELIIAELQLLNRSDNPCPADGTGQANAAHFDGADQSNPDHPDCTKLSNLSNAAHFDCAKLSDLSNAAHPDCTKLSNLSNIAHSNHTELSDSDHFPCADLPAPSSCLLKILDAGCGEGSHLANIQQKLEHLTPQLPLGVGMDLSKEGIQMAARDYDRIFWCVGDLAQCPFRDGEFQVILNILSPANYTEFARILTHEGVVIKVVPEKDYLKELRSIFYEETEKQDYSNAKTVELFQNHLQLTKTVPLHYTVTLEPPQIGNLVRMTPLTWGAPEERIQKALGLRSLEITVDLAIMVGRKSPIP